VPSERRPPDGGAVDTFLQLLARAVQQFRTYPPTSPLCLHAIETCHRALVSIGTRDQVDFRIAPRALLIDDAETGRGTIVEHELASRLHAASVAAVSIDRAASLRELSRFCGDLVDSTDRASGAATLQDRLAEHGVERLAVQMASRPEVLPIGAPDPSTVELVRRERVRRENPTNAAGTTSHLYSPGKAWIRLDPASDLETVSLIDLALLAGDPSRLASMLLRLTEDDVAEADAATCALEQKYSDVATIFAALDPRLARQMFARLARAVLDLPAERRQSLLRGTILPGLLDGRQDGVILRDFPDLDLAESLCLLLDLEAAAPEVVMTALGRLNLPPERQASVEPLLESGIRDRAASAGGSGVDSYARKLLRVGGEDRSFAEFVAFDLALDGAAVEKLAALRHEVEVPETLSAQLGCLYALSRLEPNPETVERFAARAMALADGLGHAGEWNDLAGWLSRFRELAGALRETRPDVAEAVERALDTFSSVPFARRLVRFSTQDEQAHATACLVVGAVGTGLALPLLSLLEAAGQAPERSTDGASRSAAQLLCDRAALFAPALAPALARTTAPAARVIVRVLGLAGAGYEAPLGEQLGAPDQQTVREALRALARIGTSRAAALVAGAIQAGPGWVGVAAEETLWRLPRAEVERQVRELLARREFVTRQPKSAIRLMQRVAQGPSDNLQPVLRKLVGLRYRLWNPPLARVGRKAAELLAS
jgi:hypothetical protein